jgi:hypothetical protein
MSSAPHAMHENSLLAYYSGERKYFSDRELAVLEVLARLGIGTDREVKERGAWSDMNDVRPRITELIKKGVVEEVGTCECPVTGQQVRKLRIKPRPVTGGDISDLAVSMKAGLIQPRLF